MNLLQTHLDLSHRLLAAQSRMRRKDPFQSLQANVFRVIDLVKGEPLHYVIPRYCPKLVEDEVWTSRARLKIQQLCLHLTFQIPGAEEPRRGPQSGLPRVLGGRKDDGQEDDQARTHRRIIQTGPVLKVRSEQVSACPVPARRSDVMLNDSDRSERAREETGERGRGQVGRLNIT